MSVATINAFLAQESGRFQKDILQKSLTMSPWLKLMPQGTWDEEMGNALNVITFGRTLPASAYADNGAILNPAYSSDYWTDIGTAGFDSASVNNCSPPTVSLKMGTDKVAFNLQHTALQSQKLCVRDLMNTFQRNRQLAAVKKNLADVTGWMLTEKFRRDYTYWTDHKIVVIVNADPIESTVAGGIANADTFNFAAGPTALKSAGVTAGGRLKQALLTDLYDRLYQRGAADGAFGTADGSPVFTLVTDSQTSGLIKRETNIRADFHWSDRSNELLTALNVRSAPVMGFQHVIDPTPPRWNYTAGAWVKVEPYIVKTASNGGFKVEDNSAYQTATWQDSYIHNSKVVETVFPGSQGNSNGTGFSPVNYRGEWDWRNIQSMEAGENYNPDGEIGFWRGVFVLGAMPQYTNYGVVIRHARCKAQPAYGACDNAD